MLQPCDASMLGTKLRIGSQVRPSYASLAYCESAFVGVPYTSQLTLHMLLPRLLRCKAGSVCAA